MTTEQRHRQIEKVARARTTLEMTERLDIIEQEQEKHRIRQAFVEMGQRELDARIRRLEGEAS